MCNPANLEKVMDGKYEDHNKAHKIDSHNYDYYKLEREIHADNQKKLEEIRNDKDHQEWLNDYFYKKYPNMKGA